MSLTRAQNISISLDGFATGEGQTRDAPFGHAGERLHEWMFATRWGRNCSAGRVAPAESTTPSCGCSLWDRCRDHGCREVRPPRMA